MKKTEINECLIVCKKILDKLKSLKKDINTKEEKKLVFNPKIFNSKLLILEKESNQ
jgi:hypothetical protein